MSNSTTPSTSYHFSARSTLVALGIRLQGLHLFGPVRDTVHIAQQTVPPTPVQKLYDAFIALVAGAHGLVEMNKRLRTDPSLQAAFGRHACAAQSVVQDPLDATTEAHVAQMPQAMDERYRRHSRGSRHDYGQGLQLLEADMTGMPCGKKAAFATQGDFAKQRNRRGRQLGRVLATRYDAVVVDRLCAGTIPLRGAMQPLVQAAEQTWELSEEKRCRTVWRLDAGGGSVADVKALLTRGYHVHGKDYSGRRPKTLMASVAQWVDDPRLPERQAGWGRVATAPYSLPDGHIFYFTIVLHFSLT